MKGINSPFKRNALNEEADQSRADIIFAQETHLTDKNPTPFRMPKFLNIVLANAPSKKTGVFIAICDSTMFQQIYASVYPADRYIILVCLLNGKPNVGQIKFLQRVLGKLTEVRKGDLLIGGDFNMVCDLFMDSTAPRRSQPGSLKQFLNTRDLFDVWRCHHDVERDYSLFSKPHLSYSRIELFITDK